MCTQEKVNVNTKFYDVNVSIVQSSQFSQSESWSLDGCGFSSCTAPTDSQLSVSTPSCSFSLPLGGSSDTQTKLSEDSDLWWSLVAFVSTTGATSEKKKSHLNREVTCLVHNGALFLNLPWWL